MKPIKTSIEGTGVIEQDHGTIKKKGPGVYGPPILIIEQDYGI